MINEYSCGALVYQIVDNNPLFLVIKQRYNENYGFPKGHMEDDESKLETAIREVKEETGIGINVHTNIYEKHYYEPVPGVNKEVTIYLAEAINTNIIIQEEEILFADWLTKEETLKLLTHDIDKKILERLSRLI